MALAIKNNLLKISDKEKNEIINELIYYRIPMLISYLTDVSLLDSKEDVEGFFKSCEKWAVIFESKIELLF